MSKAIKYDGNNEPIKHTKTIITKLNRKEDFAIVRKAVHEKSKYGIGEFSGNASVTRTYKTIFIQVDGIAGLTRTNIITKAHKIDRERKFVFEQTDMNNSVVTQG